MITLGQEELDALAKNGKVMLRATEAKAATPSPELVDLLQQMTRFSGIAASALSRPATAFPVSPPQLAPVVHVSPPTVNLSPQVTVERPTRWKFTVVKRDWSPRGQGRIEEIIAESY